MSKSSLKSFQRTPCVLRQSSTGSKRQLATATRSEPVGRPQDSGKKREARRVVGSPRATERHCVGRSSLSLHWRRMRGFGYHAAWLTMVCACGSEEGASGAAREEPEVEPVQVTIVGTRMTVDATKNCLSVSTSRHRFGEYRTISNCQDSASYWIEDATGYCYRFTGCWPSSGFRQTEGDTGCGLPLCE